MTTQKQHQQQHNHHHSPLHREIAGATIIVQILQGRGLIAKDRNLIGRRTTSDPYVICRAAGKVRGRTRTCTKTLSPVWNETIQFTLGYATARNFLKNDERVSLQLFDYDKRTADDAMGVVHIPVRTAHNNASAGAVWYAVEKGPKGTPDYCRNAQGEVQVQIHVQASEWLDVTRGQEYPLHYDSIVAGVSWDVERGQKVDIDSSCVAVSHQGRVLLDESVYYGNLHNENKSILHSGDEKTGDKDGDDETITVNLSRIPQHVAALYFILNVASPHDKNFSHVQSAVVHFCNADTGVGLCRFAPADMGQNTSLFLLRMARATKKSSNGNSSHDSTDWKLTPISEGDAHARDFGTLIPQIKGYTRDLVPHITVDPTERLAIMRKGGIIRIADYLPRGSPPIEQLTMGLAWDVTNGQGIDLDASAILLTNELEHVDTVSYQQLQSKDGSIQHSGDELQGDKVGDDEMITITLSQVSEQVRYICFVVNSYSGQELDDIDSASCHLFDPRSKTEVAKYNLTNSRELDKHTALLMGAIFRDQANGSGGGGGGWDLIILSEPSQGRTAGVCLSHLQNFLRSHPPPPPTVLDEPEIVIDSAMPEAIPIEDEILVIPDAELDEVLDEEIVVEPHTS